MTSAEYQKAFDVQRARGFYPTLVDGRWNANREEFRAEWQHGPAPCRWYTFHSMTREAFERMKVQYSAEGYVVTCKSTFTTALGMVKYQAIWMQDCGPVGTWNWTPDEIVTIRADGSLSSSFGGKGSWENKGERTFVLTWENGNVDTVNISRDERTLTREGQGSQEPKQVARQE